jgi:hypothetical protein
MGRGKGDAVRAAALRHGKCEENHDAEVRIAVDYRNTEKQCATPRFVCAERRISSEGIGSNPQFLKKGNARKQRFEIKYKESSAVLFFVAYCSDAGR